MAAATITTRYGSYLWTKKSEVVSPMPVVSTLMIQKKIVSAGTFLARGSLRNKVVKQNKFRSARAHAHHGLHRVTRDTRGCSRSATFKHGADNRLLTAASNPVPETAESTLGRTAAVTSKL